MAKKTVADAAKAKAAKQKKIAIGLVCLLALAAAYAAKTMMSLNSSGGAKPEAVATVPEPVSSSTSTTPLAAPTLATTQPATSYPSDSGTTTPTATTPSQLIAAVQPSADTGQLQSFSRFATKDPFDALGPKSAGSTSGVVEPASGSGSSGKSGKSGGTTTTPVTPTPPTPPPTAAVISVNGVEESVSAGSNFPAAATTPFFQLVSLTAKTAQVAIAGGSYATGQSTLTLTVNKAVTLVNTADGTRYTLLLWPQGTVVPVVGSSSSPSLPTTTTSTTPSTTP